MPSPAQPDETAATRREAGVRLAKFALLVLSIAVAVIYWVTWYGGGSPVDARAFYDPDYARDEFVYLWTPAFAQVTAPLRLLDFASFVAVVRGLELTALVLMAPYGAWAFLLLPPVAAEINAANINLLLVLAIGLSVRYPALWAFPLLTKPSAGVAMLWYVVRREWRSAAIGVGVAGLIALISLVLDPGQWVAWVGRLVQFGDSSGWPFPWPVWPRLPIAAAIVVWGARTNRPWTVVLAAIIGMPRLYFLSLAMFVGLLPLMRRRGSSTLQVSGFSPAAGPQDAADAPHV